MSDSFSLTGTEEECQDMIAIITIDFPSKVRAKRSFREPWRVPKTNFGTLLTRHLSSEESKLLQFVRM